MRLCLVQGTVSQVLDANNNKTQKLMKQTQALDLTISRIVTVEAGV